MRIISSQDCNSNFDPETGGKIWRKCGGYLIEQTSGSSSFHFLMDQEIHLLSSGVAYTNMISMVTKWPSLQDQLDLPVV